MLNIFLHQNVDAYNGNDNGWTQIHHSAKNGNLEKINSLADIRANTLLKTKGGTNCLYLAAANGYLNVCKALTDQYNFDIYMTNNYGWTALHYSAENGSYELIKLFLDREVDVHLKTKTGLKCLHIA